MAMYCVGGCILVVRAMSKIKEKLRTRLWSFYCPKCGEYKNHLQVCNPSPDNYTFDHSCRKCGKIVVHNKKHSPNWEPTKRAEEKIPSREEFLDMMDKFCL